MMRKVVRMIWSQRKKNVRKNNFFMFDYPINFKKKSNIIKTN